MRESVVEIAPWMTAWPALPALLLAMVGLVGLRRELRPTAALWAVLLVALLLRVVLLPIDQHQYDGHEQAKRHNRFNCAFIRSGCLTLRNTFHL